MRLPELMILVSSLSVCAMTGLAEDTVPSNPFLYQNSSQPIIHFNAAQTDAVSAPMPKGTVRVRPSEVRFLPASLAIPGTVHKVYDDGSEVLLASTNSSVMKLRVDGGRFEKIDEMVLPGFEDDYASPDVVEALLKKLDANYKNDDVVLSELDRYMKKYNLGAENAPNGLYTMIDRDGHLYAGYGTTIFKIGDADPGQTANSKLKVLASQDVRKLLPEDLAQSVSRFLGINMTYDGFVVIAMPGLIAAMDRDLEKIYTAPIAGEAVDNGIAIAPDGIYVVTSKFLRKLVWTGTKLSMEEEDGAWKEPYPYKADKPGMWLSRGSGATPTLMGFADDSDKLVFIPDAGDPVQLLAFWRDQIPADAKPVEGFSSKRLAAAIPIKFPVETTIEWSPHVHGNGIMVFASDFPEPVMDGDRSLFKTLLTMGYTRKAPVGADKFSWDENSNTLRRDWAYIDRGITWTLSPVSTASNAVYLNTLQDGEWRILGFDWDSGEQVADIALPDSYKFNCAGGFIYPLPDGRIFAGGMFGPTVIELGKSGGNGAPFSSIAPIDSSKWAVDPSKHGMKPEEFIRSESLHFMKGMAKREGINEFYHFTSLAKAADKWVVSPNNDVIYSMAIVDTSQGFTLTLPKTGDRFITAQIVTEEHMSHQLVGGGVYEFEGTEFNGSHVAIGVRVGTDATAKDVEFIVKKLQPQMKVKAPSAKPVPDYDEETLLQVRAVLMEEYDKMSDTFGLMTDDVHKVTDWERFTYATAGAWGLSADKYAMYLPYSLPRAKKDLGYVATYTQPKVGQFWSITAYNNEKYLMSDKNNIINTGNVVLNDDGTFTVHFGPERWRNAKGVKNFILVTEDDWGFLMRAYEPDVEAFRAYEAPEITPIFSQVGDGEIAVKPITKENYVVAETDWYFAEQQKRAPVNTFTHNGPVSKDAQDVIRSNRDVMYSLAVVDISKGATFTIPKRDAFQAIHIMDENHLTHRVVRAGESVRIGPEDVTGGSHVYLLARTKITDDMDESLAAQRAMKIEAGSAKPYPGKGFDDKELVAARNALVQEYVAGKAKILEHKSFVPTLKDADLESYLYAAAVGWGGLPSHTAQYLPTIPGQGNVEPQKITVPKPDLDWDAGGFFSLTTYDADGWIVEDNFYIDHTRMQNSGDRFTIYLNSPSEENNVTVSEGWTGVFRFYLPKNELEFIEYIESLRTIKTEPVK